VRKKPPSRFVPLSWWRSFCGSTHHGDGVRRTHRVQIHARVTNHGVALWLPITPIPLPPILPSVNQRLNVKCVVK
jgi:hypothetical protein